jgi:putative ABC transport system permease protein
MWFLTIVWKNLLRRRVRTLLTISGLGIAVAAVVALVGIAAGFERSYIDLFNSRQVDLVVQRASTGSNLNRLLDYSVRDKIRALPGVKEVLAGQMDVVAFPERDLLAVIAIGWELDSRLFKRLEFLEGHPLQPGAERQVLLGKTLADNLQKHAGDTITLYDEPMRIVGVFDIPSVFERGSIIMPLPQLQQLMQTHQVTAFSVSVENPLQPGAIDAVRREIEALDPMLLASPVDDFVQNINEIRLARTLAWVVSAIALVIGTIGMLNTMVMSVAERVRELGVLRAIGWPRRRVMSMIVCEALLLGAGGAVVGTLAAVALTHFLSGFPATSGVIQDHIAPAVMVEGLFVALLVGATGGAYPAFWGASLPPAEAMRRK